jgi:hypothetical protein
MESLKLFKEFSYIPNGTVCPQQLSDFCLEWYCVSAAVVGLWFRMVLCVRSSCRTLVSNGTVCPQQFSDFGLE